MYRAGWETKVYGSRNYSKPTICAEGETMFNSIKYINELFPVVFVWLMHGCVLLCGMTIAVYPTT